MADGRPDWIGDPEEHPEGNDGWLPVSRHEVKPAEKRYMTPSMLLEQRNKDRRNDREQRNRSKE